MRLTEERRRLAVELREMQEVIGFPFSGVFL